LRLGLTNGRTSFKDLLTRDAPIHDQLLEESTKLKSIVLTEVITFCFGRSAMFMCTIAASTMRPGVDYEWWLQPLGGLSQRQRLRFVSILHFEHLTVSYNAPICRVLKELRLTGGTLFPIPVTLDLTETDLKSLDVNQNKRITLRDPRDDAPLAILTGKSFCSMYI
jgi:hypothetical protein